LKQMQFSFCFGPIQFEIALLIFKNDSQGELRINLHSIKGRRFINN